MTALRLDKKELNFIKKYKICKDIKDTFKNKNNINDEERFNDLKSKLLLFLNIFSECGIADYSYNDTSAHIFNKKIRSNFINNQIIIYDLSDYFVINITIDMRYESILFQSYITVPDDTFDKVSRTKILEFNKYSCNYMDNEYIVKSFNLMKELLLDLVKDYFKKIKEVNKNDR